MSSVLIVEDDIDIAEKIKNFILKWIRKNKYPITEIKIMNSVQDALGILNTKLKTDLIIVDSEMPVLNGLQFIRHFQGRFELRKVLMTSDPLVVSQLIEYAKEGVDAVLPKPVTEEMLERILDRLFF